MTTWMTALEAAADTLGEMLVEMAEGLGSHDHEDIAAAVLRTGLTIGLEKAPPDATRVDEVGRVLYAKLHDGEDPSWLALTPIEKGFWLDIATSAVIAADAALLPEISVLGVRPV